MRLLARLGSDEIAMNNLPLAGSDLTEVRFDAANFAGASFEDANLTNTAFVTCDLSNARFEGAVLVGTEFVAGTENRLEGARFGDLAQLHSIATSNGLIESHEEAVRWLHDRSHVAEPVVEPCAAARQLRLLFGKYVTPLGTAKRHKLPVRALVRGEKQHSPERTLEEATSHGYLARPDYRDHVARGDGDHYTEMIEWVKSLTMTPNLRDLLDDLCDIAGCEHVPRTG
jgi:uncharacterized protein YjbI with pentapeptide repeats